MKFKKVSSSLLSAHRRKELKELTNVKNGPAKLSKKDHIRTYGQTIRAFINRIVMLLFIFYFIRYYNMYLHVVVGIVCHVILSCGHVVLGIITLI